MRQLIVEILSFKLNSEDPIAMRNLYFQWKVEISK